MLKTIFVYCELIDEPLVAYDSASNFIFEAASKVSHS